MSSAALLVAGLLCSAAVSAHPLEPRAAGEVRRAYERSGRMAPEADPRLSVAARAIAAHALRTTPEEAAGLVALTRAISDAEGADPSPRALVIRTTPVDEALAALGRRADLPDEPASHYGVGLATEGERAALVLLTARRIVTLERFPRVFSSPGETQTLCGRLAPGWKTPELFITRPDGTVEKQPPSRVAGGRFCAHLTFPREGTHSVEVLAHGARGPEVGALFLVDVGRPRTAAAQTKDVEPRSLEEAREELLRRVNLLRRAHGVPEVRGDPALDLVAQRYSERMAREGFFTHVAPDGSDLEARLKSAGYRHQGAGENLGLASGPLAAHFGIEQSPGHRRNLLDPRHRALGIGIALRERQGRTEALVTEVLAAPLAPAADPLDAAYRALEARRAARLLPPLSRDETLRRLAEDHARKALASDSPTADLPSSRLHERVFAALPEVKRAAVELYVADDASQLPDSEALADGRNDRVGIGLARGDSKTHGADRVWMVVIFAAGQPRR